MSIPNPPAFPTFEEHEQFDEDAGKYRSHILPSEGMSLRDYFAAKTMQALIPTYCQGQPESHATWLAKVAYEFADAMLKTRGGQ